MATIWDALDEGHGAAPFSTEPSANEQHLAAERQKRQLTQQIKRFGDSSPRGASCPPLGRTTWHYFVDNIELLRSSIPQTTPDPSGRRTPSRRRLVTKFGSVPISSSPRTPWWRNSAALATGRRCSRPFLAVFREILNKNGRSRNRRDHTAAALPPRPRAAHTAPGHPGPAAHRVWAAAASI